MNMYKYECINMFAHGKQANWRVWKAPGQAAGKGFIDRPSKLLTRMENILYR